MAWYALMMIVGFAMLVRGADVFIDGAVAIARKFAIPEIVIGLTIVAMGTSAPEAAVSITSAIHGANGVAIGNVLGSNIANILLILGVTASISALSVGRNTIRYEIPFVGFITLVLIWMGVHYGAVSHFCALVLCILFLLFLLYLFRISKNGSNLEMPETKPMSGVKIISFVIGGLIALVIGGNLAVNGAVGIARILNVSERIIGLTIVAFGTSLPELVTCIIAALKKQSDIAIGNIVGSNIFNILFVLGIAGLIRSIPFEPVFLVDAVISLFTVILLWIATVRHGRLSRPMGALFFGFYIVYIIWLILAK